jgi:hypothetical protein
MATNEISIISFCEIPFLSATILDAALTSSGSGKAAIQKYRHQARKTLDPGLKISVGRGGTLQLTTVPALAYVATATRWNKKDASKLVGLYKKAGFIQLAQSKDCKRAVHLVSQAIQARMRNKEAKASEASVAEIIPRCWIELTTEHEVVRDLTMAMHNIFLKVDQEAEQIRRLPGRLVRSEGKGALVTINTGDKEELRLVDGSYLKSAGIHQNGTPFVLHEYKWSPDTTMNLFFPALDLNYDTAAEAARMQTLKDYEIPLPAPPAGLFSSDFVAEANSTESAEPVAQEPTDASETVSKALRAG